MTDLSLVERFPGRCLSRPGGVHDGSGGVSQGALLRAEPRGRQWGARGAVTGQTDAQVARWASEEMITCKQWRQLPQTLSLRSDWQPLIISRCRVTDVCQCGWHEGWYMNPDAESFGSLDMCSHLRCVPVAVLWFAAVDAVTGPRPHRSEQRHPMYSLWRSGTVEGMTSRTPSRQGNARRLPPLAGAKREGSPGQRPSQGMLPGSRGSPGFNTGRTSRERPAVNLDMTVTGKNEGRPSG